MAVSQSSKFCYHCDEQMMFVKQKPNHVLHFFLSVFTLGIWALFVWIPVTVIAAGKQGKCTKCGMVPSVAAAEVVKAEKLQARVDVTELQSPQ